jgi:acyl carrier protein
MDRSNILAAIEAALTEVLNRTLPELDEDTRLFDHLHLDSTSVLELLMALEDAVDVEVDLENLDVDDFQTVGTLADYVIAHLRVTAWSGPDR